MMQTITVNDLFKAAEQIEVVGQAYYGKYAQKTDSEDLKKTFNFLAFKEETHLKKFQELLETIRPEEAEKGISEENRGHISLLMNQIIYNQEKSAESLLKKIKNNIDALNLALQLENESIKFYDAIKPELSLEAQRELAKIIVEEETHVELVSQWLDDLT